MASKFKRMNGIKDTEGGNFGNYEEYNGGGSPKGGVWGGANGRVGWDQRKKQGEVKEFEHRKGQPRTKDGKFTYNSVNGKETEYESRGKTVNPLLTGGKNGIMIEDVEKQFEAKEGSLYDKYKDKWYQKGSEKVTKEGRKYVVKLSSEDIWEIARRSFDIEKGGFDIEDKNWDETKRGRPSAKEAEAKVGAKKEKGEVFVKDKEGGIGTRKFSDEEKSKISSDRTTRREFIDYLKGAYGKAPEAFAENGTTDALSMDEKKSIVEKAKKAALSRLVRAASTPKPAPAPSVAPTSTPKPTAPEGKVYKYEKASNNAPAKLKGGTKYDEAVAQKVSDQLNAMEDLTDEDKQVIREILTTKSPEEIDAFIDDLINSGFITL